MRKRKSLVGLEKENERLRTEIKELKEKALKVEDDCIMCPHKKALFDQDEEIERLREALKKIISNSKIGISIEHSVLDIARQALGGKNGIK